MYRVAMYIDTTGDVTTAIGFRSTPMDRPAANALLAQLVESGTATGGEIEQHVPGIGWVLAEE